MVVVCLSWGHVGAFDSIVAPGTKVQLVKKDIEETITPSQDRVPNAMGIFVFLHIYDIYYENTSLRISPFH